MLLVDSSVWIDFFNGKVTRQTLYLRDEVKRHEILLGDLILCEVLQGFRSESDFLKARQLLLSFPCQNISGQMLALQTASVECVSDSVTHHFGIPKGALRRNKTRLTHPTWLPGYLAEEKPPLTPS